MKNSNKTKKLINHFKKIFLTLLSLALLAVILFFGIQAYIDQFSNGVIIGNADTAPEADAVIVLGAFVGSEKPSPILEDRLLHAYELYNKGKVKKILLSGDHGQKEYDEVNIMRKYLLEKGVPG